MTPWDISGMLETLASPKVVWSILWGGAAMLTLSLMILMRTRWGQARPLSKCVVLSVLAHILLIGYAHMTQLFFDLPAGSKQEVVRISLAMTGDDPQPNSTESRPSAPWDRLETDDSARPDVVELNRPEDSAMQHFPTRAVRNAPAIAAFRPSDLTGRESSVEVAVPEAETTPTTAPRPSTSEVAAAAIEVPKPASAAPRETTAAGPAQDPLPRVPASEPAANPVRQTADDLLAGDLAGMTSRLAKMADAPTAATPAEAVPDVIDQAQAAANRQQSSSQARESSAGNSMAAGATASGNRGEAPASQAPPVGGAAADLPANAAADAASSSVPLPANSGEYLPPDYRLRVAPQRLQAAQPFGATFHSERAVQAALRWLVASQSPDGRWDADLYGAGRETAVHGHDRAGAGADADTAITGLAILALQASGNTHLEGTYRKNVQHGLEFLLRSQASDGNLAGDAKLFAVMYCHGIASLALSEAYAMTRDDRLRPFVERAVAYSVAAQHPTQGGWRYRPGDLGDMSQFGWQVMALRSAQLAGVEVPQRTKDGMHRFLQSCCRGQYGGLCGYRPGEAITRTMTAEALACRFFLSQGKPPAPTVDEAAEYLLQQPPGSERSNLYYWYYASLALYQLQDDRWHQWNEALQTRLVADQRTDGVLAGSWDPDTVWGTYGGRVYSTAMAALCLEVYYRYLPLFSDTGGDAVATP